MLFPERVKYNIGFQNLMQVKVRKCLLVSSLYDLYLFEEEGSLYELIHEEYTNLYLSHPTELIHISSGKETLELLKEKHFDLIVVTPHIEDMNVMQFANLVEEFKIPILLLVFDSRELSHILKNYNTSIFERIFLWQGNVRLLIAMIKYLEDKLNVEQDTENIGVQSIILVEDNIRFYSSYLPLIYTEILKQSYQLVSEGINFSHRHLRMCARPKILLSTTYEEAVNYFEKYEENILGVISDVDFDRNGIQDEFAGISFAKKVREKKFDIPILLQSNRFENEIYASEINSSFILKSSPTLLNDVSKFIRENFGFGDFVFTDENKNKCAVADDLKSLEENLKIVPESSIKYHSARNHFSNWLKARTEFFLAYKLRPRKISDYNSIEELRQDLIASISEYRQKQFFGTITNFSSENFKDDGRICKIGTDSIGGKARGLSFVNMLIHNYNLQYEFENIKIFIPTTLILATDVFDDFIEKNNLKNLALNSNDDEEITNTFLNAKYFPKQIEDDLKFFLEEVNFPLAVRSSSLLEDSQYHPFAGVYQTFMLTNNHDDIDIRLLDLINCIKKIFACIFYQNVKEYIKVTPYNLEEEKMAVIIQKVVGSKFENRFYPEISGVGKSHNFYPIYPQKSSDGIVSLALGLGKTIVDGGQCVRFSPKYPKHILQFASVKDTLQNTQKFFFAIDLNFKTNESKKEDEIVKKYDLSFAEKDETLNFIASTYSPENDKIYESILPNGIQLITFSQILKGNAFPVVDAIKTLLEVGSWAIGSPIEMEFAIKVYNRERKVDFAILQMRPLVVNRENEELNFDEIPQQQIICRSSNVLGNGIVRDIFDIVFIDKNEFDRSQSKYVVEEIHYFNQKIVKENKSYILFVVGRLGSLDPWLGIPVVWEQISGAKIIVESQFKDFSVEPSQGSHFFQNLNSFDIGYFTIGNKQKNDFIDWDFLKSQKFVEKKKVTSHIRFNFPLNIVMNWKTNSGIIQKPN